TLRGGHSLCCEVLGCSFRRDPVRTRIAIELPQRVADAGEVALELVLIPAVLLEAEQLQDAARVDDEVGRVEDPRVCEPLRVGCLAELVVRRPGDDLAAQARN